MFTTQKNRTSSTKVVEKSIYKKLQYESLNILNISVWKETHNLLMEVLYDGHLYNSERKKK